MTAFYLEGHIQGHFLCFLICLQNCLSCNDTQNLMYELFLDNTYQLKLFNQGQVVDISLM